MLATGPPVHLDTASSIIEFLLSGKKRGNYASTTLINYKHSISSLQIKLYSNLRVRPYPTDGRLLGGSLK